MGNSVHPQTVDLETVEGRRAYARLMLPKLRADYLAAYDRAARGATGTDLDRCEETMRGTTAQAVQLVTWL